MLLFVSVFVVPILSVFLFEKMTRTALSARHWVYMYAFSCVMVNLVCLCLTEWVKKLYLLDMYSTTFLKNYLIFSIVAACVIPAFAALLKKHIDIWVDENEKKAG